MHGYLSSSKQKTDSQYNYPKIITWINKIQSMNSYIFNTVPMVTRTLLHNSLSFIIKIGFLVFFYHNSSLFYGTLGLAQSVLSIDS